MPDRDVGLPGNLRKTQYYFKHCDDLPFLLSCKNNWRLRNDSVLSETEAVQAPVLSTFSVVITKHLFEFGFPHGNECNVK